MEPREYLLFFDDLRHQKLTFFRFVKKRYFAAYLTRFKGDFVLVNILYH
jgi:hypothetical protein